MKRTSQPGFTIVEMLIVIIIIGILATLVMVTFNGIQQKARDNERVTDIKALHGQIEAYFIEHTFYPSLNELNDTASGGFLETNMKGLDKEALRDPRGNVEVITNTPTSNTYSYEVAPVGCDNSATACNSYTLTAKLESGTDYVKKNLN